MRTLLPIPASWTRVVQPHQTVYLAPGAAHPPTVVVSASVLVGYAADDDARARGALEVDLGGRALRRAAPVATQTEAGWPVEYTAAQVLDGDREVEQRLLARYRFAEWRGVVLARGLDASAWASLEPAVRAALAAARPDWRGDGEVYCIAHLYE